MLKTSGILFLFVFLWPVSAFTAQPSGGHDFVVIQPGQPGTAQDAQPVMDSLSAYLGGKTGSTTVGNGHYFNDLGQALACVGQNTPLWGIVSLGFYLENASKLQLTPIASTRPGGAEKENWTLLTRRDGPSQWNLVRGTVRGTMLFNQTAASCILFGVKPGELAFELVGTFQPLKSLRSTARGRDTGIVLDRLQFQAMKNLPQEAELKTILNTGDLPSDPVVWFGPPEKASVQLAAQLIGMKADPAAADLLKVLQTDGFGPPDPTLANLVEKYNESCSR
jgi:hypothetical protein